jgi:spermidine/putrescine ABC transporter ATP-binding subunit
LGARSIHRSHVRFEHPTTQQENVRYLPKSFYIVDAPQSEPVTPSPPTEETGSEPSRKISRHVKGGHSVTISHITRRFATETAVNNVSLEVPAGEFVSILGPSGCGKTTLLRIIAGLDFPDEGRILIDNRDVTHLPPHKRPTNLVFQRGALFPHRSVYQNVAYPLERRGMNRQDVRTGVAEALSLVRLNHLADRRPSELSGGQAQRVALARALAAKPAVLLLDEPLSALDLLLRKEMQLELRHLQERLGTTFIYVTHDQEEALTMSRQIVIMRDGSIIQVGTPREIYDNPTSVFASTFIGESNLLFGTVTQSYDGLTTIRIGEHVLRAPTSHPVALETQVALSIRPERIRLDAAVSASSGWNDIAGTVEELIFLGNRVRARVACGETRFWVEEPPTTPNASRLSEGSAVTLGWPYEDGRVISPDEIPTEGA